MAKMYTPILFDWLRKYHSKVQGTERLRLQLARSEMSSIAYVFHFSICSWMIVMDSYMNVSEKL